MKTKTIIVYGEEYEIYKTKPFSVGYGTIGSKGIVVTRKKDNYRIGHFKSISDFRDDRKQVKLLMKKMIK